MFKFLFFFLLIISNNIFAQNLNRENPVVNYNNQIIKNPWTGGVNAVQISELDIDRDGVKDLIVFDRTGNRIIPLINSGINNSIDYVYASEYIENFPKLKDWVLFVDYNCDNKADLFTYNDGKVKLYKNTSNSELEFTLETNSIITDYSGSPFQLYITRVDLPAITDIDYDGDIDILTFQSLGGYIEFHENKSQDLYGNCDSVIFQMTDACWGDVYEGLNTYTLNDCNTIPINNIKKNKHINISKHTGSSILTIDIDNDADKDLILGDVSYDNLNLLINGGSSSNAIIDSVDQYFPSNNNNTISTEISSFPAAFYQDVNNDGVKDLISSPNIPYNCEDKESVWLYLNNGSNNLPEFNLEQKNFIQDEILDFGTGSYPIFYDYNMDGKLDIICGNFGYFDTGDHIGQIAILENTGTLTEPTFNLVNEDFANLSATPLNTILNLPVAGISPTFGDLDGDNDDDMIIGDADGKLHYFENIAGPGNPIQMTLNTANYFNIDVGQYAAPVLWDLNNDGLLDIIIGKLTGDLVYLQNNGTINNPIFDTILNDLGQVSVSNSMAGYGYSRPYFYIDDSNTTNLILGTESGHIYRYNNIDNNLIGTFSVVDTFMFNIWDGIKTSVSYEDINNDNIRDLIIGNQSGGLIYYASDSSMSNINSDINSSLKIYPNPSQNYITINLIGEKRIYDIYGRNILNTKNQKIDISKLKQGPYFIRIKNKNGRFIKL